MNDGDDLADVEVIDLPSLEESNSDQTCNEVPGMPSENYAHFAMWDDYDKTVLCCGGWDSVHKGCFEYAGDEWNDLGDILLHARGYSSAAELHDGSYWISGGGYGYELGNAFFFLGKTIWLGKS